MNAKLVRLQGPPQDSQREVSRDGLEFGSSYPNSSLAYVFVKNASPHPVQARMYREGGLWKISREPGSAQVWLGREQESGMKWKTVVEPNVMNFWDHLRIGDVQFVFVGSGVTVLEHSHFIALIETVPAINEALLKVGMGPIRKLYLFGRAKLTSVYLTCKLKGFYADHRALEVLNPNQLNFQRNMLRASSDTFDSHRLSPSNEPIVTGIRVEVASHEAEASIRIPITCMPLTSWLQGTEHWHVYSLACFVQPGNEAVRKFVQKAAIPAPDRSDETTHKALQNLYEALKEHVVIDYQYEPAHGWGRTLQYWQSLRMPQEVLGTFDDSLGKGTCIDLVLMCASALERLKYDPLIALIDLGRGQWHALLGVWGSQLNRVDPYYTALPDSKENMWWVDVTRAVKPFEEAFDAAQKKAEAYLADPKKLVAILDVAGARKRNILPLPFDPLPNDEVRAIREAVLEFGKTHNMQLGVGHYFYGLLKVKPRYIEDMMRALSSKSLEVLLKDVVTCLNAINSEEHDFSTSDKFEQVFSHARNIAGQIGQTVVTPRHVVHAVVQKRSDSLSRVCKAMGIGEEQLREYDDKQLDLTKTYVPD